MARAKTTKGTMWGLASAILLALNAEAAAGCWGPGVIAVDNEITNRRIFTSSGRPCALQFVSAGPTFGVDIVQRPTHGIVRIGVVNRVIYQSNAGYIGSDSFTYVLRGLTTTNRPTVRTIRTAVTVTR